MPVPRYTVRLPLLFLFLTAAAHGQSPPIKGRPVKPAPAERLDERLDLVYASYGDRPMRLDLFRPKDASEPLPAVLIVHGGGWLQGDKARFRPLAQALASRGYVTAAIEYRLGGEAKFPAAVHDCHAAVRWLRANAGEIGIDPARIGAVGGSAGGHLVGLVAAAPQRAELQGDGGPAGPASELQAAVVMAGPFELATGPVAERSRRQPEQSNTNRWLGKAIDEAPELYRLASPFTHLSASTPPLLFLHGEFDRPEQNLASRQRLRELGVWTDVKVYHAGRHGCWNQHPWFEPMVDDIDAFLSAILKKDAADRWQFTKATDWGEIRFAESGLELRVTQPPREGVLRMPRLNNPVSSVHVQGEVKTTLKLTPGVADWAIALPPVDDGQELTIFVETVGRPHLPTIPRIVGAAADGSIPLAAHDAVTHGESLRYEPQPHKNTVGYWTRQEDWCQWHFYCEQPGAYELRILQGCGEGQGGSEVAACVGGREIVFSVEDTGHFQNFKERSLGVVALDAPQVHTLELRPRSKAAAAVMDVRQVRLVPVNAGKTPAKLLP